MERVYLGGLVTEYLGDSVGEGVRRAIEEESPQWDFAEGRVVFRRERHAVKTTLERYLTRHGASFTNQDVMYLKGCLLCMGGVVDDVHGYVTRGIDIKTHYMGSVIPSCMTTRVSHVHGYVNTSVELLVMRFRVRGYLHFARTLIWLTRYHDRVYSTGGDEICGVVLSLLARAGFVDLRRSKAVLKVYMPAPPGGLYPYMDTLKYGRHMGGGMLLSNSKYEMGEGCEVLDRVDGFVGWTGRCDICGVVADVIDQECVGGGVRTVCRGCSGGATCYLCNRVIVGQSGIIMEVGLDAFFHRGCYTVTLCDDCRGKEIPEDSCRRVIWS